MLFTNKPEELAPENAAAALIEDKLTLIDVRKAWEKARLATEHARKSP